MENGISQVLQRIRAIEAKFQTKSIATGSSFQNMMEKELNSASTASQLSSQKSTGTKQSKQMLRAQGNIADMITTSSRKYGVDPKLALAIAQTESNYNPAAVSEAGAVGVMQLMPDTAASLGVQNAYDPQENIEGGVKYIKQMLNNFDGNIEKAVAAYNAGPQAVKSYGGVPPYAETKDYVEKVLDLYS